MDDQTEVTTYGSKNLPDSSSDRPLVTFLLTGFNQEKYIREAVEGAFSQTYSPLEIILSDDCSTDKTYEIMSEMAKEYQGPHRVLVRANVHNLRTYSHVLEALKECKSDLIVFACGDDISKPDRTSRIVEASLTSGAWAFHSKFDMIDEDGKVIAVSQQSESLYSRGNEFDKYFNAQDGKVEVVHGATSAYRRELIDLAPANDQGIYSEDGVFTLILNMKRKTALFVDSSLVLYRAHAEAITNTQSTREGKSVNSCIVRLNREMRFAKTIADRAILAISFFEDYRDSESLRPLNKQYLKNEILIQKAKYDWGGLSLFRRLQALTVAASQRRIGYIIPSMLGRTWGPRYLYVRSGLKVK